MSSRLPFCFVGLIEGDLKRLINNWLTLFNIYNQIDLFRRIIDHGSGHLFYTQIDDAEHAHELEQIMLQPFPNQVQHNIQYNTNFNYHTRRKGDWNAKSLAQSLKFVKIRNRIYGLSQEQLKQYLNELPSDISWTAMFYKHAMSYLGYTALNQVDNIKQWANDIALAALVAPDFYDFGELV